MKHLAIRDIRDPFTIALSHLLRGDGSAKMRERMLAEMPPLVKQVAVTGGLTGSEEIIRVQAIETFTGTISLYLASLTDNRLEADVWANAIARGELRTLFREGFTMITELAKLPDYDGRYGSNTKELLQPSPIEPIKHLLRLSRWHEEGEDLWGGYVRYREELSGARESRQMALLAEWLMKESVRRASKTVDEFEAEFFTPDHIIVRALINMVRFGKISVALRPEDIAELRLKAKTSKKWAQKIEKALAGLLEIVPKEYRGYLENDPVVDHWRLAMKALADKKVSMHDIREQFETIACIAAPIEFKDMKEGGDQGSEEFASE